MSIERLGERVRENLKIEQARGVMLRIGFVACCMKLRILSRRQSI